MDVKGTIRAARTLRRAAAGLLAELEKRRERAREAMARATEEIVEAQIQSMPVDKLKETTDGTVRFAAIKGAGYTTVAKLRSADERRLVAIKGVGPQSAIQAVAAARQMEVALRDAVRIRLDPATRPKSHTELLIALQAYGSAKAAEQSVGPDGMEILVSLDRLFDRAAPVASRLRMFFIRGKRRTEALAALEQIAELLRRPGIDGLEQRVPEARRSLDRPRPKRVAEIWAAYEEDVVAYNGWLIDIGGYAPAEDALHGFVPSEIAAKVNRFRLVTDGLNASLRGYQSFGAKFALVQRRSILGDEMGLGKTVEALAALAHLDRRGHHRFLVVCPASVLVNWLHEIEKRTKLVAHRLHGPERATNQALWRAREGGRGSQELVRARRSSRGRARLDEWQQQLFHIAKYEIDGYHRLHAAWTGHPGARPASRGGGQSDDRAAGCRPWNRRRLCTPQPRSFARGAADLL